MPGIGEMAREPGGRGIAGQPTEPHRVAQHTVDERADSRAIALAHLLVDAEQGLENLIRRAAAAGGVFEHRHRTLRVQTPRQHRAHELLPVLIWS